MSHLVGQPDDLPGGLLVLAAPGLIRERREELESFAELLVHVLYGFLVPRGEVTVEILCLQYNLCHVHHGTTACRGWSIESPGCTFLTVIRKRFVFRGTIQGVGFRPAVYRLADSLGLRGFVQNRRSEVVAEVQGDEEALGRFASLLTASLPPAARVDSFTSTRIDARADESRFQIVESAVDTYAFPPIPPDLPVCADCARELLDPSNRRHLYPFITCTQCGPRYSIVARTPFDRENTSMRPFPQCRACAHEYADPADRRFHSQTNSCRACGPRLSCVDAGGSALDGDPLPASIRALIEGRIVAVEGIGGFHLAADPKHPRAMARLRREKERERKPFALMVRDIEEARALCLLSPMDERLLSSPKRRS